MAGSGAYTTVNGDVCDMDPGDLVVTPNWNWHDHNNRRDEPMIWFDGLDLPLVTTLESIFFENHPELLQPVAGANLSERTLGVVGLREAGVESPPAHSPLLRYRWSETDATLDAIHRDRGGRLTTVEYINSLTGAPRRGHLSAARCTGCGPAAGRLRRARRGTRSTSSSTATAGA
jgi:gentisate 1,2-dioxygenase